jgi:threonine dehydrogenase-like Zn-dependent dehydrogenase
MLAAVYHDPLDLRVEQREIPSIAANEILLRVECASICATDLRIIQGSHRKFGPGTVRIPGHEIVGILEQVGSKVSDYRVGDRAFIAPNVGCGHCRQCRARLNNLCPDYEAFGITLDGGFAQYMRVTAQAIEQGNVILIDQSADAASMALVEPFSCVMHGQDRVGISADDIVLIEGAGPIGIMHLLLAKHRGARRIIVCDRSRHRLARASALGAHRTIDVDRESLADVVMCATDGTGPDVTIVAAASPAAFEAAVSLTGVGGRINFFAGLPKDRPTISLDANLVHYKELIVTGSTGCSTNDCRKAVDLVASGQVDLRPLISGQFPLLEVKSALEAARDERRLKVILEPFGQTVLQKVII